MKEEIIYSNIFYFRKISKIGGTEQFLYEIAKKYHDIDITIFFDEADSSQLQRLRKYVRCRKRIKGKTVKCIRAFFNFNLDMIDEVESTENYYAFISHANYEELGYKPPIDHTKLTHFFAVSQFATDKLDEWAGKLGFKMKTQKCLNPLILEPKEKVMIFVSAARLDDEVKGGKRVQKMIEAVDRYCDKTGKHYLWLIFSNPNVKADIKSKNVVIMQPRVDVRPYISMADYVIHLPNDMETYCYTINEALGYGVPVVTTPLSILNELNIPEEAITKCEWDMSNVDNVVEEIFTKEIKHFQYKIPEDNWNNLLVNVKSNYEEERDMKYIVEATDKYKKENISDNILSAMKGVKRYVPNNGEQWEVDSERKDILLEKGFIRVIKEINEGKNTNDESNSQKSEEKKTTRKTKKVKE